MDILMLQFGQTRFQASADKTYDFPSPVEFVHQFNTRPWAPLFSVLFVGFQKKSNSWQEIGTPAIIEWMKTEKHFFLSSSCGEAASYQVSGWKHSSPPTFTPPTLIRVLLYKAWLLCTYMWLLLWMCHLMTAAVKMRGFFFSFYEWIRIKLTV